MVLSNAERQKLFRERRKAAVTPDDVRRAVRLLYEDWAKHEPDPLPYEEWLATFRGKRGAALWDQWPPDSLDPDDYPDDLAPDDLALLLRVAAVVRTVKFPPE